MTHEFQPDHNGTYYCVRCGRTFMQLVEDLVTNPLAMQALATDHLWWQALPPLARRVAAECETGVLA